MDWKQQHFSTYLDEHADCVTGVTAGDGSCTVVYRHGQLPIVLLQ